MPGIIATKKRIVHLEHKIDGLRHTRNHSEDVDVRKDCLSQITKLEYDVRSLQDYLESRD